ncbi:transmembrane protease serine 12-like [Crotalus tigris]|uniref:transmembrane protease serine 12-like n=1 Tax=Crotalus tigris TaxID=88082 RepID=UPI00192F89F8|nr:transmembrane protease serine 12-like [Crotalus tigris]
MPLRFFHGVDRLWSLDREGFSYVLKSCSKTKQLWILEPLDPNIFTLKRVTLPESELVNSLENLLHSDSFSESLWFPEMWRAVIGLHHLFRHKTYTIRRRVQAIRIHYFFDTATYKDDIAVFHLSKPITFNSYVQPVCLPNFTLALTSDMTCFISGWGMKKEKTRGSFTLQEAQLRIFSLDICNRYDWHAGSVPDTAFCAGSETGGVDTCQGDSGGPLVCLSDSKYYIVGITSYGIGCGRPKFPGIYTNLPKFMFWVKRQLSETNTVRIQHVLYLAVVWNIFQLIV